MFSAGLFRVFANRVTNVFSEGYTLDIRSYAIGVICWRKECASCGNVFAFRTLYNRYLVSLVCSLYVLGI